MMIGSFRLLAAHCGLAGNHFSRERSGVGNAPSPSSTHAAAARDTSSRQGRAAICTPMKMIDPVGTPNQEKNVVAPK